MEGNVLLSALVRVNVLFSALVDTTVHTLFVVATPSVPGRLFRHKQQEVRILAPTNIRNINHGMS